jgi:nitroreductase
MWNGYFHGPVFPVPFAAFSGYTATSYPRRQAMIDLIRNRRSIRKYTDEPIDRDKVDLLVETLLRSPSSRNINPWEFVLVDDRELLARLALAKKHGSELIKGAPLAIVICADETRSDVWVEDCSITAILVQLAAQSLGLGSCWVQIRERMHASGITSEKYVRELLGMPEHIKVEAIIAIGWPAEKRLPLTADKLQYEKVMSNRYGVRRS